MGVTTLLPLVEEVVTVASADQDDQVVPSIDVQCSILYCLIALVPDAAPLQESVTFSLL